ncbi:uncharacterized protein LOC105425850 isoform X1 [Pogonomyrmex barbatus]|uniref:Uncharacterized protein LOC105425850 isoform X1 n=2 Tax=Pogonomyrmex barbatus TaxID=144034 RepID=A0A6I9WT51_9HYME|nr:uncharacterized protein LOC105425850 isoform X1 [Pogonomyrmex barbatus]
MKHFFLRVLCGRKREKRKNSKNSRGTKRVVVDDGHCACCLAPFLVGRGVRCSDCGARSCRKACSRWDTSENAWHCIFCHQQRAWLKRNDKWFDNFGGTANEEEELHSFFGTAKSRVYVAGHAAANVEQNLEDREERRMVHAVRNFVEKIVDGLVENVDDTPIDRLYEDSEYDKFLEEHRPPLTAALTRLATCLEVSLTNKPSTDPPAMAHAALREIVERAVEEARKLPGLSTSADAERPREGRAVADNSYEDLLATAILNKVIERYQRERVDGNSNVLHDTDSPKAKCTANESEHGLEEDAACYASDRLGSNGASIGRNEDRREPVSFMMEERIEEVTTITSDDDEPRDNDALEFGCARRIPFPEYGMDIVDPPRELPSPSPSSASDSSDLNHNEYPPVRTKRHAATCTMDIVSPIESWEDNWLFQKRKTSRSQPDAVAMLVPSSNADYKALIGDRDAEDTSDLSECSSTKSDEEIEKELMEAINNVIPRTPRISECETASNYTDCNQEETDIATQLERDEVDTCQVTETKTKTNERVIVGEYLNGKNREEHLKSSEISEEKPVKYEDDKGKQNEKSSASITMAKEEDKAKEETKKIDEKTIAIMVESSAQKEAKTPEKSSERSDRGENIDENEEQRESEYTEHYDTAIQRHLDSLTKVEVYSGESEMVDRTRKTTDEQLRKSENNSTDEQSKRSETEVQLSYATIDGNHDMTSENDPLSAPPRPGTIAEREHKKWENAPPIENNPYSEESIRKRCLERQYSRNSDIPGVHYELTKLNEANLEALLTPERPDIKRFGRDYYINQSKAASGERQERARSMSSMSSRPSSSLSQQSSCAGDEQRERQVSHRELERFEAASLRGSLPRRCCRDPRASPHFAINPLLHLESASDRSRRGDGERVENLVTNGNDVRTARPEERKSVPRRDDARDDRGSKNFMDVGTIFEGEEDDDDGAQSPEVDTDFRRSPSVSADWNRSWNDREDEEPIVPRYDNRTRSHEDERDDRDPGDYDSGMCSIGSRDSENSERDRWRRLYRVPDNDHSDGNGQISSIGGRRFWTTGGYKYHTFGGIRIQLKKVEDPDDDLEDESVSPEDSFADRSPEVESSQFAKLKFQTFGGIKRSRRIDGRRIPNYRRIRLRPILPEAAPALDTESDRDLVETERSMNRDSNVDRSESCDPPTNLNRSEKDFEEFASFEHSTSSTFEESDCWQDEEDDITNNRISTGYLQIERDRNRTNAFRTSSMTKRRNLIRKRNVNSSSFWSLPNEDDEWRDKIDCASDEIIMNKFLKDVSRRRKASVFNDNDVVAQGRETRSNKQRVFEDNSEKLGKSISRNTERNLGSSKESQRERKSDDKKHCKKLYVRSLSDVTIW